MAGVKLPHHYRTRQQKCHITFAPTLSQLRPTLTISEHLLRNLQ